MPRKTATSKSKRTRKPKAVVSITQKTDAARIKAALKRSSQRLKKEITQAPAPIKPIISTGTAHTKSSHVLSLAIAKKTTKPLPETPSIGINLFNETVEQVPQTVTQNDLVLASEDLEPQLTAADLTQKPTNTLAPLALLKQLSKKATVSPAKQTAAQPIEEPVINEVETPQEELTDIFAYFDLPETDEPEEADIVTLDEITIEETIKQDEFIEYEDATRKRFTLPSFSFSLPSIQLPTIQFRAIASFVVLSFVLVLPLHAMNVMSSMRSTASQIEQSSKDGVTLLTAATDAALAQNATGAARDFSKAQDRFDDAAQTVQSLGIGADIILSSIPGVSKNYKTANALITIGDELATAGQRLAEGYAAIDNELAPTPVSRLNLLHAYLESALPHLQAANNALADIDASTIPESEQTTLELLQHSLPILVSTTEEFIELYPALTEILGANGTKRYLLVFQNNTEIRPTGGFIGSFAELKVHDGIVESLNVPGGGSYDLQGQLTNDLVAPGPLQLLTARWEFQDANWFPDFPTTARQLIQFYRDAGGPSVDGVLAVNATFVADLITTLGPIDLPEHNKTITGENFIFEAQRAVEVDYDREENKPKAFIGDLAPHLVEAALEKTSSDFLEVVDLLTTGLSERHIQIYANDTDLQRTILSQGWGGELANTPGDYLMIVDTNLGGGKTDGVIEQNVDMHIALQEDGSSINTLTISRTHFGIKGLLFTGVNNVDYLRVYVPKQAELLSAEGFTPPEPELFERAPHDWTVDDDLLYAALTREIDTSSGTEITQEHGKTVFGNWVQTKPGETSTVTLTYKVPATVEIQTASFKEKLKTLVGFPDIQKYQLYIQKQSGIEDRNTTITIDPPETLLPIWASHPVEATTLTNETDHVVTRLFEHL